MAGKRLFLICAMVWGAILLLGPLQSARAEQHQSVEDESPQLIADGMATKACRGIANVSTGWVEFPKQIYVSWNEEGWAKGISVGPLKGIGMAIVRTVAGAGELATFFIPYPGFFDPYFEPSYVWQKE